MTNLISAFRLAHEIEEVVVIDVRWSLTTGRPPGGEPVGRADYKAGHVPGAFFVDLDTELAGPPGERGRHPLPDASTVEAALRRCGVSEHTRVVVYDGRDSWAASRAWWVFRWAGLRDVRVLDGGFAAWSDAGLPVSSEQPEARHGDVVVRPGAMPVIDAAQAEAVAREGLLLDARPAERYAGAPSPLDPVPGHVPGAVSSPSTSWQADDGMFRRDLAKRWAEVGAGHSDDVAVYCGSGITAAHQVLALAEIGVDAALYPGSWSEWSLDPGRPVATGPEPG
ncbi:MAG: sulfurtransferase [Humibacillus sp.]|nr:sulfurtransferase [Humibacillus sp.]MDN5779830.1 sulfurtransferase [Humibacillus sp.]